MTLDCFTKQGRCQTLCEQPEPRAAPRRIGRNRCIEPRPSPNLPWKIFPFLGHLLRDLDGNGDLEGLSNTGGKSLHPILDLPLIDAPVAEDKSASVRLPLVTNR